MKAKKSRVDTGALNNEALTKRLDAIIRLLIETKGATREEEFTEAAAARILKSVRLTPTEIAKILGKKSATDVAPYLYGKKEKKISRTSRRNRVPRTENVEQNEA